MIVSNNVLSEKNIFLSYRTSFKTYVKHLAMTNKIKLYFSLLII